MGIERIIKENFPYVNKIEAVNPVPEGLTLDMVEKALAAVKSTITSMKGEVVIKSVDPSLGSVLIAYRGPPRLKQGLELILKDVKMIKSIQFEDL
jgi:Fe-S cluster biogenesis protein NfuA